MHFKGSQRKEENNKHNVPEIATCSGFKKKKNFMIGLWRTDRLQPLEGWVWGIIDPRQSLGDHWSSTPPLIDLTTPFVSLLYMWFFCFSFSYQLTPLPLVWTYRRDASRFSLLLLFLWYGQIVYVWVHCGPKVSLYIRAFSGSSDPWASQLWPRGGSQQSKHVDGNTKKEILKWGWRGNWYFVARLI